METRDPMGVYPLEDWLSDYAWFCREGQRRGPHSASMGMEDFEAYFLGTRKDPVLADHCLERFLRAVSFLEANIKSLDFGKAAVVGDGRFMIHKAVVVTLYRFFVGIPDYDIDVEIPLDQFIEEVKKVLPSP